MPIPLILWAAGAMLSGLAAGKGAEAYGDQVASEAKAEIERAEKYVSECKTLFAKKRRTYLNKCLSYAADIRTKIGRPGDATRRRRGNLPPEIEEAWASIITQMRSLSAAPDNKSAAKKEHFRNLTLNMVKINKALPSLGPIMAFAGTAYVVKDGISHALRASSFREEALTYAKTARIEADTQLDALKSAYKYLKNTFDDLIIPWLDSVNDSPNRPYTIIILSSAVDEFEILAKSILKEFSDE